MKKKIILLTLLLVFPISGKALDCSYAEQARLRKIASNVTTSYEVVENGDTAKFNITLTNVTNEIYVHDNVRNADYYFNGSNEITISGYEPGTNVRYLIYPTRGNCTSSYSRNKKRNEDINSYLTNKYVNLPYYNKYYKDPLCEGKSYSICGKWQRVTLTYDEFVKTINEYDKKNNEEIKEEKSDDKNNIFDIISKFIFDYYIFIIAGGAVIFVLTSLLKKKKSRFDF